MSVVLKSVVMAAGLLALTAGTASAGVVCNDEGDCWHSRGRVDYPAGVRVHVHPDNWRWKHHHNYRWREHAGRGYWRGGVWVDL